MTNFTFEELIKGTYSLIWETSIATIFNLSSDVTSSPVGVLLTVPLIILLLIGSGLVFGYKTKFVQFRLFKKGLEVLKNGKKSKTGISPMSALLLGTATRVGSGNIVGVTAAIALGGPGAIFWMWFSALVGMGLAFFEATFSQMFKEKHGDEYSGGLPYYFAALSKSKVLGGVGAIMLITAFTLWIPTQAYNILDSLRLLFNFDSTVTQESANVSGSKLGFVLLSVGLILVTILISIRGSKGVSKVTDVLVPIMAGGYVLFVLIILILNLDKIPYFFTSIFGNAFTFKAAAGGIAGATLLNGIKRGLFSNEAGQGSTTMAAATAETNSPIEQGLVQTISVFIDTIIICTVTAIPVVMAGKWEGNSALQPSEVAQGLSLTVESFKSLLTAIPLLQNLVDIVLPLSLALFAYTTVIGQVAFAQINLKFFTKSKIAMIALTLFIVIFSMGVGTYYFVQGKQLGDVLTIADIAVGMLAITNIIFMLTFAKYITKALKLFEENKKYDAEKIGITDQSNFWNQRKAKELKDG